MTPTVDMGVAKITDEFILGLDVLPTLMTIDSWISATVSSPDVTIGLPKRKPGWSYILCIASGENLPVFEVGFQGADPGMTPAVDMGVAKVTNEFILGLDVLPTHSCGFGVSCGMTG
jgi:hypothetical protein